MYSSLSYLSRKASFKQINPNFPVTQSIPGADSQETYQGPCLRRRARSSASARSLTSSSSSARACREPQGTRRRLSPQGEATRVPHLGPPVPSSSSLRRTTTAGDSDEAEFARLEQELQSANDEYLDALQQAGESLCTPVPCSVLQIDPNSDNLRSHTNRNPPRAARKELARRTRVSYAVSNTRAASTGVINRKQDRAPPPLSSARTPPSLLARQASQTSRIDLSPISTRNSGARRAVRIIGGDEGRFIGGDEGRFDRPCHGRRAVRPVRAAIQTTRGSTERCVFCVLTLGLSFTSRTQVNTADYPGQTCRSTDRDSSSCRPPPLFATGCCDGRRYFLGSLHVI
jgi:hypothetical protein